MAIPPGVDQSLIKYFKLVWTPIASDVDTVADTDENPDLNVISGAITLKPTLSGPLKFSGIPNPFTLSVRPRTINLSDSTILEQGRAYVKLECATANSLPVDWYWKATFSLAYKGQPITLDPVLFMGLPDATVDLTDMIQAATSTETPSINDPSQNIYVQNQGGIKGARRMSQAEYNALGTRNPDVIYVVI